MDKIDELKETIESYKKIADDEIKKGTSPYIQIQKSKKISEVCEELLKIINNDESSSEKDVLSAEKEDNALPVMGLGDYLRITCEADAIANPLRNEKNEQEHVTPQYGKKIPHQSRNISKEQLSEIKDRKERFELSMLYLLLHGGGTFIPELSIEDLQSIIRSVKYVKEACDYSTMKDGAEYLNIKVADDAYNNYLCNEKVFEETPDAQESLEEKPEVSVRKISNEELKKEVEKFMDDPVFGKLMNFFAAYGLAKHIASLFTNGRH